jgi:AraC family transcriptional regulator, regulatory protein of adaptative response / methylated-DNA-[protein]-cysteine methyltransferase
MQPSCETSELAGRGKDRHEALSDYAQVRRAIEFLSSDWREQPDLNALAGHLGLSPAYCQRLFKRWCGLSPKEFLQAITIDHARELLKGSASVLDTAFAVGLSGPGRLHDLFVSHEAMTPGEFKRGGEGLTIVYGFHPSPFGHALVMMTGRGLCGLAFCDEESEHGLAYADMAGRWPEARFVEDAKATEGAARRAFGERRDGPPLEVVLLGTDFEVSVWRTLMRIPMGQLATYSDVAARIGQPKAARAVGAAVGRNPVSFIVPCHRVVGKSGKLTGYHWGLTRKQAIIGWEKGRLSAVA